METDRMCAVCECVIGIQMQMRITKHVLLDYGENWAQDAL